MGPNQNTRHNNNEDCFVFQLQENKEKHSSNYTRFHKQIERERFHKQARINNKNYKARMREAHPHAWKPNNTPCNTNNENPAHGLGRISSRQRIETLL